MTARDARGRPKAAECLQRGRACALFPEAFFTFAYGFFSSLRLLDLVVAPRPVLAGAATPCDAAAAAPADGDHHLWFAVPKSRISRSKKRTKAHGRLQNLKFKPRSDWRVDENTGRPVLRHRLLDSDLDATVERVREAKKAKEVTKEDN